MKDFADRFRELRIMRGLSQKYIAELCGMKQQTINNIESGITKAPRKIEELAKVLKTTPEYLLFGKAYLHTDSDMINLVAPVKVIGYIPIVLWQNLLTTLRSENAMEDLLSNPEIIKIPNFNTGIPEGCLGTRFPGDSMRSNNMSFSENDVLIFNPHTEPCENCFVIALMEDGKSLSFRQYIIDSGDAYLKPLNDAYPLIKVTKKIKILGVVINRYTDLLPQM